MFPGAKTEFLGCFFVKKYQGVIISVQVDVSTEDLSSVSSD